MAKTQWMILLSTCLVSGLSLVLILVAFLTTNWIEAEASNTSAIRNSQIHYGIFGGSLTRHLLATETNFELTLACSYELGACIYSCQGSEELRNEELQRILTGQTLRDCTPLNSGRSFVDNLPGNVSASRQASTENILDEVVPPGLWLSTLIFLSVTASFALFVTAMTALNVFSNPVEPIWGVFGLYVWNITTVVCTIITMSLWGILYGSRLTVNIAVTDTLQQQGTYQSKGLADLGFSFWLLLGPIVLHSINCGLLAWRTRLLDAEPNMPTFVVEAKRDMTDMSF